MRPGVVLLLALVLGAVFAASAVAASVDMGRDRPPAKLSEEHKSIWMSEWVACTHQSLGKLAKEFGMKIPSGRTPQTAARLIARVAESPLWNLEEELVTAVDGCRNGILWRYYHQKR